MPFGDSSTVLDTSHRPPMPLTVEIIAIALIDNAAPELRVSIVPANRLKIAVHQVTVVGLGWKTGETKCVQVNRGMAVVAQRENIRCLAQNASLTCSHAARDNEQ